MKQTKRRIFYGGLLLVLALILLAPSVALAADPVTQILDLKVRNEWTLEQNAGVAVPNPIEVGQSSYANFTVKVNYELQVSGNVYATTLAPGPVGISSWEIYLEKRSGTEWLQVRDKSGNDVKIRVINSTTPLVSGSTTQFPVQAAFATEPIATGEYYRWVTHMTIENGGQPDPTDYQLYDGIRSYSGP